MLASKSLSTFADFTNPDSFCLSNLQPIPTDDQRFSTCMDSNETFGEMGSIGIPLFFEFNKCLGYMFCCTTLFYFLPVIALIAMVSTKSIDALLKDPSASSQSMAISIGIFLYDPIMTEANLTTGQKGFGIRYLSFSDRKEYIGYCALLIILAVVVFVIALTCARIHLVRMAFRLDDAICT
jgi:hypothetical protein